MQATYMYSTGIYANKLRLFSVSASPEAYTKVSQKVTIKFAEETWFRFRIRIWIRIRIKSMRIQNPAYATYTSYASPNLVMSCVADP